MTDHNENIKNPRCNQKTATLPDHKVVKACFISSTKCHILTSNKPHQPKASVIINFYSSGVPKNKNCVCLETKNIFLPYDLAMHIFKLTQLNLPKVGHYFVTGTYMATTS